MADTSIDDQGVLVPLAALNKRHINRWRDDSGEVIEQDMKVVAIDRPDLFPSGPLWRRLDLGGCIVFSRRPTI